MDYEAWNASFTARRIHLPFGAYHIFLYYQSKIGVNITTQWLEFGLLSEPLCIPAAFSAKLAAMAGETSYLDSLIDSQRIKA